MEQLWPDTYTVALDDTAAGDFETQRRINCYIGDYVDSGEAVGERRTYRHSNGVAKLFWCETLPDGWFSSAVGWCFECDQAGGPTGDGKVPSRIWVKQVIDDSIGNDHKTQPDGIRPPSRGWQVEPGGGWGAALVDAPIVVIAHFAPRNRADTANPDSPQAKATEAVSRMVGGIKDAAGQFSDVHTKHLPVAKEKAARGYESGKQYLGDASSRCHAFWTHPDTVQCLSCLGQVSKDICCALGSCGWGVVVAICPAGCCEEEPKPKAITATDPAVVGKDHGTEQAPVHEEESLLIVDGADKSAFGCFSASVSQRLMAEHPDMSLSRQRQILTEQWQTLSVEERSAWDERSKSEVWGGATTEEDGRGTTSFGNLPPVPQL